MKDSGPLDIANEPLKIVSDPLWKIQGLLCL